MEHVEVEINHDSFFDASIHNQRIDGCSITNCWNCAAPLTPAGYFWGSNKLLETCRETSPKLLKQLMASLPLPKHVWPIPQDANTFVGHACSYGCALEILNNEKRCPNAHAKLLNMLLSQEQLYTAYAQHQNKSFNRKLCRWFGGPMQTPFCCKSKTSYKTQNPLFALFDSNVSEQKFTIDITHDIKKKDTEEEQEEQEELHKVESDVEEVEEVDFAPKKKVKKIIQIQ